MNLNLEQQKIELKTDKLKMITKKPKSAFAENSFIKNLLDKNE